MQVLSEAFKSYRPHIRHERGLARRTCAVYAAWARHFERWLESNGYPDPPLTTFCLPVLKRYLYALSEQGLRPRTIHSTFNPLRGLGAYLVATEAIPTNPILKLTLPKKDAARRVVTNDEEIGRLMFDQAPGGTPTCTVEWAAPAGDQVVSFVLHNPQAGTVLKIEERKRPPAA